MSDYEVIDSRRTFDGQLSGVRVDTVRMPDGSSADREVVEHPDAVAVVPITQGGEVVLLRQYRHPLRRAQLEVPAGKLDEEGESPAQAARRELAEEARLDGELTELARFANSAGWTDEHTTVFLARPVHPVDAPEGFEAEHEEADLEVVTLPLERAVAMVTEGEIVDAKTVIGLLLARDRLR